MGSKILIIAILPYSFLYQFANRSSCLFPCYAWLFQLQKASHPLFGKSDTLFKFKISVTCLEFAD